MKCQYCGSEVSGTSNVCQVCGSPLQLSQGTVYASSEPAANVPPVPVQNYAPQQSYNGGQNVNYPQTPAQNYNQQQFNQPPVNSVPQVNQNNGQPIPGSAFSQSAITKESMVNLPEMAEWKKNFRDTAIIAYIAVAFNFILACVYNPVGIVVELIVLGLVLGAHLKYNKPCAIAYLTLASISFILNLISGLTAGMVLVAIGGWFVKLLFDLDKLWIQFQNTGVVPTYTLKKNKQK